MATGLQAGVVDQCLPCRERRQGDGRRAPVVRSGRLAGEDPRRRADVLGGGSLTRERNESVHPGTQGRSCDTGPVPGHDTGHLVRGNDGCPLTPGSLEAPAGWRPGPGTRCGLVDQLFGACAPVSAYCAHRVHEAAAS
jgi:hypothetical protein